MKKKFFFSYFFFLLLFPTYQTPKPNRTEPKPNAIGWFSVPSLQISFKAQYVKTEILGSVQKLSSTPTKPNRLHPQFLASRTLCVILWQGRSGCTPKGRFGQSNQLGNSSWWGGRVRWGKCWEKSSMRLDQGQGLGLGTGKF